MTDTSLTAADLKTLTLQGEPEIHGLDLDWAMDQVELRANFSWDAQEEFGNLVSVIPLHTWLCTDTWVDVYGLRFGNEYLGVTCQPSRKSCKVFYPASTEAIDALREIILDLVRKYALYDGTHVPHRQLPPWAQEPLEAKLAQQDG